MWDEFLPRLWATLKWAGPWLIVLAAFFIAKSLLLALPRLVLKGVRAVCTPMGIGIILRVCLMGGLAAAAIGVHLDGAPEYDIGDKVTIQNEALWQDGLPGTVRSAKHGDKRHSVAYSWLDGGTRKYGETIFHEKELNPR